MSHMIILSRYRTIVLIYGENELMRRWRNVRINMGDGESRAEASQHDTTRHNPKPCFDILVPVSTSCVCKVHVYVQSAEGTVIGTCYRPMPPLRPTKRDRNTRYYSTSLLSLCLRLLLLLSRRGTWHISALSVEKISRAKTHYNVKLGWSWYSPLGKRRRPVSLVRSLSERISTSGHTLLYNLLFMFVSVYSRSE